MSVQSVTNNVSILNLLLGLNSGSSSSSTQSNSLFSSLGLLGSSDSFNSASTSSTNASGSSNITNMLLMLLLSKFSTSKEATTISNPTATTNTEATTPASSAPVKPSITEQDVTKYMYTHFEELDTNNDKSLSKDEIGIIKMTLGNNSAAIVDKIANNIGSIGKLDDQSGAMGLYADNYSLSKNNIGILYAELDQGKTIGTIVKEHPDLYKQQTSVHNLATTPPVQTTSPSANIAPKATTVSPGSYLPQYPPSKTTTNAYGTTTTTYANADSSSWSVITFKDSNDSKQVFYKPDGSVKNTQTFTKNTDGETIETDTDANGKVTVTNLG